MTTNPAIEKIHATYVSLTGFKIGLPVTRYFIWEAFMQQFSEDDLRLVVNHLKSKEKKGRMIKSLHFMSFIGGPYALENFEEALAEAKAEARKPEPTPRDKILRAAGRSEPLPPAVTAKSVLESAQAFEKFREWRKASGI